MAENQPLRNLIDREAAVDTYVFDSGSTQMPAVLIRMPWSVYAAGR